MVDTIVLVTIFVWREKIGCGVCLAVQVGMTETQFFKQGEINA